MNDEFAKLGRTWWFIALISTFVSVAWLMGKVDFAQWQGIVVPLVGIGGGKSGLQAIGKGLAKK